MDKYELYLAVDRILRRIRKEANGCWIYEGAKASNGYAAVWIDGKTVGGHTLMFEHYKGPVPDGQMVMHICSRRPCVNPDHLKAGTNKQNVRDAIGTPTATVQRIRELLKTGASQRTIAGLTGVSRSTVSDIKRGKSHEL